VSMIFNNYTMASIMPRLMGRETTLPFGGHLKVQ
jgi:hypothetical protein